MSTGTWTRYAALGDSITEGWCDPVLGDGEPWFGWADRLALAIDAHQRQLGAPRLEFANLAVRGRRVKHVVDDQVPDAISMRADLVSVLVGGNDLMSFRIDADSLASRLEGGVVALRAAGAQVLLMTCFDPGPSRMLRVLRHRTAVFNAHLVSIAHRHGCTLVDGWGLAALTARSGWAEDRIHPSTIGHLALARAAASALRLSVIPADPDDEVRPPAHLSTLAWLRRHGAPWLGRRLRRVSSGDGRGPKLPHPRPVGTAT